MEFFKGQKGFTHSGKPKLGILLVNLGTPDEPTTSSLRRYLREFLSDPRIIEIPNPKWWLILNLFVLPFRPRKSAALYRSIWTKEGSPFLVYSNKQRDALKSALERLTDEPIVVEIGMRIGNPSIASVLDKLRDEGINRLLILPLYPQYSSTTTGSAFDAVADALKTWRWLPELRMTMSYHDHPGYIAALAKSVREVWDKGGKPERLLMSFHGIPQRYFDDGDPYYCYCQKTGRLLADALGLSKSEYLVSFQSLFGREEWIKPYTSDTLEAWGKSGLKKVDVICPGFSVDCLETIEEIEEENKEVFLHASGHSDSQYRYIHALNDRPEIVDVFVDLVQKNTIGWEEFDKPQWSLQAGVGGS